MFKEDDDWQDTLKIAIGGIQFLGGDLWDKIEGVLAIFGGIEGFAERYDMSADDVYAFVQNQLGLESDDDASSAPHRSRRKIKPMSRAIVMCPHCKEFVVANDGPGIYPCNLCKKDFEVSADVFDGKFTTQDDNDSSGWAVAEWLIKSFDVPAPSPRAAREQLEETHEEGEVAKPADFLGFMQKLRLESLVPSDDSNKANIFNSRNEFADFVFEHGGRIAVCFQFAEKGLGRQWVGLEHHGSGVRVMDPIQTNGYYPLAQWHKSMGIGRVIAVYGFTGMNDGIGG